MKNYPMLVDFKEVFEGFYFFPFEYFKIAQLEILFWVNLCRFPAANNVFNGSWQFYLLLCLYSNDFLANEGGYDILVLKNRIIGIDLDPCFSLFYGCFISV